MFLKFLEHFKCIYEKSIKTSVKKKYSSIVYKRYEYVLYNVSHCSHNHHKLSYSIIIDALRNDIYYTNDNYFTERNFADITDYSCVFATFITLQSIQSRWFCSSRSCSKFFRRVVAFRCARSILDFKKQQELFRFTSRVIRARHAIYISNTSRRI